jgi:PAS domain S-box-containing protein
MSSQFVSPATPYLKRVSHILNISVFSIGIMVIMGWMLDIESFKRIFQGTVAGNPLSAICFLMCALSLWKQRDEENKSQIKLAKRLAVVVMSIGFVKFISVLLGFDFFLDTLFFRASSWEPLRNDLNRMAPNTAFCFILAGCSLFWLDDEVMRGRRPSQYMSILIMFISMLSLYGYVYGVEFLYGIANYLPMSFISALSFLLLSLAILFVHPDKGTMAIIIGDTSAEVTFLRLAAFVVPLFFGWLELKGEQNGYYDSEFGTAMFAIATYALAMFLLGRRSVVNYKLREIRRETEEKIKEKEALQRTVFESMGEGLIVADKTGKFLLVNPKAKELIGAEITDTPVSDIAKTYGVFYPDGVTPLPSEKLALSNALRGIPVDNLEMMIRNNKIPEGRYVRATARPIYDFNGQVVAAVSVFNDITRRKEIEKLLRENEERLSLILKTSQDAFIGMNEKGFIADWNPKAEIVFGWEEKDVIGKKLSDVIIPERYRSRHDEGMKHFILTGEGPVLNKRIEIEALHRSGLEFPIELSITSILQNGKYMFYAFAHDITERRRAEEEIRNERNFTEAILENIPDMIFVKDAEELRFVRFNKAGEDLLGFSRNDLLGKNDYDFFPKEQADFFTAKDKEVINNKVLVDIPEEPIETSSGKRWLHTKKIVLTDEQGNPQYLLGISEDITYRKQNEDALKRSGNS